MVQICATFTSQVLQQNLVSGSQNRNVLAGRAYLPDDAEGATAPVTLRQMDRSARNTPESGLRGPPKEQTRYRVNLSGTKMAGAEMHFASKWRSKAMPHIAVIGAGITGITTAYALHKRGFDVTVFDRHRYAAMETSFANGGQLSASNAEVWNQWSTVLKGIKWMLHSDAPLSVNPRPAWHKISWMAEFLGNIPKYKANTIATTKLAITARSGLAEMADTAGLDFDFTPAGIPTAPAIFTSSQSDWQPGSKNRASCCASGTM